MPEENERNMKSTYGDTHENGGEYDAVLHMLSGLRIILYILLFLILACVIWIVPVTSWLIRLILAVIAVAIIILIH